MPLTFVIDILLKTVTPAWPGFFVYGGPARAWYGRLTSAPPRLKIQLGLAAAHNTSEFECYEFALEGWGRRGNRHIGL